MLAYFQFFHLILEIELGTGLKVTFSSLEPRLLVQLEHLRLLNKHAEGLGGDQLLDKFEVGCAVVPFLLPLDISIHIEDLTNLQLPER